MFLFVSYSFHKKYENEKWKNKAGQFANKNPSQSARILSEDGCLVLEAGMDRLVFSIFSSISVTHAIFSVANLTSKMYKYDIKKQSYNSEHRKEFDSTSIWLWKSLPQRPRPLQYGRGIEKEINIVLKGSIYNHSLLQKGVKQHNNKDLRCRVSKNKLRNTQTIFSLNDLNIWNPDSAGRLDGHI